MNEDQYNELMKKMDLLIRIQGMNILNQIETDRDKVIFLTEIGLTPKDIMNITGIKQQYVYDVRSKHKKE